MCKGGIIQLLLEILNGLTHADPFEASAWRWTTDTSIQALCDPWRVQIKIVQMLKIVQVFYLFWPASKYKNETIDGRFWKTTIVVLAFASSCWNQRFVLTLVPAILVQLHFKKLLVISQGLEEYLWWCWRWAAGSQILVQSSMAYLSTGECYVRMEWWMMGHTVILLMFRNPKQSPGMYKNRRCK